MEGGGHLSLISRVEPSSKMLYEKKKRHTQKRNFQKVKILHDLWYLADLTKFIGQPTSVSQKWKLWYASYRILGNSSVQDLDT